MTPISSSADSVRSFIDQMGVASSGDALAVLRCLSLNINAAMTGAVSAQDNELQPQILRLERIQQSRVAERLANGQRIESYVAWPVDEANSLQAVMQELKFGAGFGPFEPLVRYQRQVTLADGSTVSEEQATTASRFSGWLTDYERSVNDLGQVVWTHVNGAEGGPQETIVFTELETLLGVPAPQVDRLQQQIVSDTATIISQLASAVTMQRFTLEDWWGDVRIDERWYRFARHNEDKRTERQLDNVREEVTALRSRLQELGQEWPTLAQALTALQDRDGARPSIPPTDEVWPHAEPERSANHRP